LAQNNICIMVKETNCSWNLAGRKEAMEAMEASGDCSPEDDKWH